MTSTTEQIEIQYDGAIERSEYEEGVRLHYMPSPLGQQLRLGLGVLLIILALVSVFLSPNQWPNGLGVLFFAALVNSHLWIPQLITSQQWRKNSALQQTIRGRVTEEMISFFDEEREEELPWHEVIYYKTSEHAVLLYQNRTAFSILTRSLFHSDADWALFLKIVSRHVIDKKNAKRDMRAVIRQIAIWVIIIVVIIFVVYNMQN